MTSVTARLPELLPTAGSSGGSGGGSAIGYLLPVLLIFVVYFGFIRPGRARARRAQQMTEQVEVGREVMTTAGLYGTVARVDGDKVDIEVAPGVTTTWAVGAIARVIPLPAGPDDPASAGDTPESDDPAH